MEVSRLKNSLYIESSCLHVFCDCVGGFVDDDSSSDDSDDCDVEDEVDIDDDDDDDVDEVDAASDGSGDGDEVDVGAVDDIVCGEVDNDDDDGNVDRLLVEEGEFVLFLFNPKNWDT